MTRKKSLQWVDFKKIMISETGMKCAEPYLSRSSSNDEQGTFSITSFPSFGDTGSCASSLSSDDNTNHVRGILKTSKRSGKPLQKRSLLHSFERPSRNIETFVKSALNNTAPQIDTESDDEAVPFNFSRDRHNRSASPEKSHSQLEFSHRKSTQNKVHKYRPDAEILSFQRGHVTTTRGRQNNASKERTDRTRSFSLDRDKLHKSSLSIYSEGIDRIYDTKSQQSSDERISLKSDLLGYHGHLRAGVRTTPRNRTSTYQTLMNRHDDFRREFNRNQRNCISRVEYIFDKSQRDVEMALIDMKIDLAYTRY